MRLSNLADYAVVLMSAAARQCGSVPIHAGMLAEQTGIPGPTAQKLVSQLARAGLLVASRGFRNVDPGPGFDEMYRGRHLQGMPAQTGRSGEDAWQVTVDGRPLHLMRRADGTWLSMVDHYGSYDTPLEAARAAVDELSPGEQLKEQAGGHHGLHA